VSRRFTTDSVEKGDERKGAAAANRSIPPTSGVNSELLAVRPAQGLVDAAAVADFLGVERSWVYEHADELGARRLGSGPRARLRFSIAEVDERLTACYEGRESRAVDHAPLAALRPRRRRRMGTSVELLPVRGRSGELAS
jgi:hypothetical protein